jgi:alkanesulfonate monooxygenase SsuD/methylene tetrahydromethanopterin reductase-like flavin-dependent oxidoreductase (luciferase family)
VAAAGEGIVDFGVFDHLDLGAGPIERYYRERLELAEAYERAGFHAYHVAEHHLTPLGMAPSPSVFLAALAQRTRRLRFGPMVYVSPLYPPLRLLEEIGMLDQMSGGRLELAFGRGALAAELRFFDVDPAQADRKNQQAIAFVLDALRDGAVTVSEEGGGKRRLPLAIPALQKPHPPLWYGVHSPQSAERAARAGMNVMTLDWAAHMRACTDRYRAVWKEAHGERALPRIGLARLVHVDRSAEAARATAARAYRRWHASFTYLSSLMGFRHLRERPAEFDAIVEDGRAFAGTPESVAEFVHRQTAEAGANYFVGQFAFGDLTLEEALRSVRLFAEEVMPMLKRGPATVASK